MAPAPIGIGGQQDRYGSSTNMSLNGMKAHRDQLEIGIGGQQHHLASQMVLEAVNE
jgi:hypothetical protein